MSTIKFSRQRESIRSYLSNTKEHPTADTIYMHIREIYPNISLGTVYRNLNLLVEQGEIVKLSQCGDSDRFDGNSNPHYHFLCLKCGCVQDLIIKPESLEHIDVIANAGFDGNIKGHTTIFYGECSSCKVLN